MKNNALRDRDTLRDWSLRFVKGALIGSGFIVPGVSGGALAAVFGVYGRIIAFISHITRDFARNVLFFLPLGLGGLTGVFLLSFGVSFFLKNYEVPVRWFFVGCTLGTLPALWKEAGRQGRKPRHIALLAVSAAAGLAVLGFGKALFSGQAALNFGTWLAAGALIALGVLIPGLSPSNFLFYLGMYEPMADAFKGIELSVLLPLALGGAACLFSLSRAVDALLARAYTGVFHLILGFVLASTVMIVPAKAAYGPLVVLVCLSVCGAGFALGYWMCLLEDRYKGGERRG